LKQCVDQAIILLEDNLITERDLRLDAGNLPLSRTSSKGETSKQDVTGDMALLAHLQQNGFDMQATAQAVGWDRSTVTQRLKGMCFRALVEHNGSRHEAAEELAGGPALVRVVELKLSGYFDHLLNVAREQHTEDESIAVCQKRFKTLPDRYLPAMETLIRRYYTSRV
jgi:hypothetical protein